MILALIKTQQSQNSAWRMAPTAPGKAWVSQHTCEDRLLRSHQSDICHTILKHRPRWAELQQWGSADEQWPWSCLPRVSELGGTDRQRLTPHYQHTFHHYFILSPNKDEVQGIKLHHKIFYRNRTYYSFKVQFWWKKSCKCLYENYSLRQNFLLFFFNNCIQ